MKKKVICFIALLLILCFHLTMVQAAGEKVVFEPSTNSIKQGENFTIKVHAESSDGINMMTTKYLYDQNVLELVDYRLPEEYTDWSGESVDELVMMITNGEIITSVDCELIFKVKENTLDNTRATIKFEQVGIDTFANTNHRFDFDNTEVSIQIGELTKQNASSNTIIIVIAIVVIIVALVGLGMFIYRRRATKGLK